MKLEDIYDYFARPRVTFLSQEEAACYVLSVLLQGKSYFSELLPKLEREYPAYRLSDTVLFSALSFLEAEGAIISYQGRFGRGRPRRLYQIKDEWLDEAQKLAQLWRDSATKQQRCPSQLTEREAS